MQEYGRPLSPLTASIRHLKAGKALLVTLPDGVDYCSFEKIIRLRASMNGCRCNRNSDKTGFLITRKEDI